MTVSVGLIVAILIVGAWLMFVFYLSLPRLAWWLHQRRMNADA